jgi:hypothetical protein
MQHDRELVNGKFAQWYSQTLTMVEALPMLAQLLEQQLLSFSQVLSSLL